MTRSFAVDAEAERRLFQSILIRVVRDLCSRRADHHYHRLEAERWIGSAPSRWFTQICEQAGYDAEAVHSCLRALVETPLQDRPEFQDRPGKAAPGPKLSVSWRAA